MKRLLLFVLLMLAPCSCATFDKIDPPDALEKPSKDYPCGTAWHVCLVDKGACCGNGSVCGDDPGAHCASDSCCFVGPDSSGFESARSPYKKWRFQK